MKLSMTGGARRRGGAPLRLVRIARMAWHVGRGLIILRWRFPRMNAAGRRAAILRWSRQLLRILHVRVRLIGTLPENGGGMLVINHISWLDIYAVLATVPVRFVAKAEIRSWPLVGRLAAGSGTLFIERGRSRHAHRTNDRIVAALRAGETVAIFPEGTTSEGDVLLPFHAALFQPAIDAPVVLQPVALRYLDHEGRPTAHAAYAGDTSLLASLWRIAGQPSLTIEMTAAAVVAAAGQDRRGLARECERVIARVLGVPAPQSRAHRTAARPLAAAP